MKKIIALAALTAVFAAGAQQPYKVIVPATPEADGTVAKMINFDNGEVIDSVIVKDQAARFEGNIDEPVLARILLEGKRTPTFILESGTISFNEKEGAFGTMLNDQLRAIGNATRQLNQNYRAAESKEARDAIYNQYLALNDSVLKANSDNALGYMFFLQGPAGNLSTLAELNELYGQYPAFANRTKASAIRNTIEKKDATSVGKKYIDFSVTEPDGKVQKLSDYVKDGKYTLVDFWASWCGPCIRQTKVLKEIREQYKDDDRLNFVGVAVWDEPDDTKRAIEQHELPWPSIINAQRIPTDIYGISGIPCILLIGPDGTILSRDKQSEELKADVDKALKGA